MLPQSIYLCNSLTTLSLSHCCIAPNQSSVSWRALKHLSLTCVELDNKVLRELLSGSPLLESLKLKKCAGFSDIDLYTGRLKRLIINSYGSCGCHEREARSDDWLDINAPNLVSLEILGYMKGKKCRVKNVSSLVHVKLTFWQWECEDDGHKSRVRDYQSMVRDLMEKVSGAQNLTVGSWLVQVFSTCELKHLPTLMSMRKRLVFETYLCGRELPGIAMLLQTSPVMEQLVLDVSPSHMQVCDLEELYVISGKDYWSTQKTVVSQCLKTVEIIGFSEAVIELVKYLLENVKALDYIIFLRRNGFENGRRCYFGQEAYSFNILQNLLRFKRASPQAKLLLRAAAFTSNRQRDPSDKMNTVSSASSGNYGTGISLSNRLMLQRRSLVLTKETCKNAEQDRISDLPDSILMQILTLLPLRDAMYTGLLSKRWDHLWASVPTLTFSFELSTFRNEDHFFSFVDKTLILYKSAVIQKFSLVHVEWERNKQKVDSWVWYALDHGVKELDLLFYMWHNSSYMLDHQYDLPSFLYTDDTITIMNLKNCKFQSCGTHINWRSLRKLTVSEGCLSDAFVAKLLAGCPVLERLELIKCDGFENMNIVNVSLKELVIDGNLHTWENARGRMLCISAPHVKSFVITGSMGFKKLQVMKLSSLVEACLDFTRYPDDSKNLSEERETMVRDILSCVCCVEKLTLGTWFLQGFVSNISNPVLSPFSVCKSLILKASNSTEWGSRGIEGILNCCPELETLTIDMSRYTDFEFVQPVRYAFGRFWYFPPCYDNINCLKHCLETVKIFGMLPDLKKYDFFSIMKELLKESRVLKKFSVTQTKLWKEYMCSRPPVVGENNLFDLGQELLSCKRSSPLAEVELFK